MPTRHDLVWDIRWARALGPFRGEPSEGGHAFLPPLHLATHATFSSLLRRQEASSLQHMETLVPQGVRCDRQGASAPSQHRRLLQRNHCLNHR